MNLKINKIENIDNYESCNFCLSKNNLYSISSDKTRLVITICKNCIKNLIIAL